jgi:hypothetical protein
MLCPRCVAPYVTPAPVGELVPLTPAPPDPPPPVARQWGLVTRSVVSAAAAGLAILAALALVR